MFVGVAGVGTYGAASGRQQYTERVFTVGGSALTAVLARHSVAAICLAGDHVFVNTAVGRQRMAGEADPLHGNDQTDPAGLASPLHIQTVAALTRLFAVIHGDAALRAWAFDVSATGHADIQAAHHRVRTFSGHRIAGSVFTGSGIVHATLNTGSCGNVADPRLRPVGAVLRGLAALAPSAIATGMGRVDTVDAGLTFPYAGGSTLGTGALLEPRHALQATLPFDAGRDRSVCTGTGLTARATMSWSVVGDAAVPA